VSSDGGTYRRFWVAFGVWLVVLAAAYGAMATVQFAAALEPFGGFEYVSRVIATSATRVLAAATVFVTSMFAWITSEHGADAAAVQARFRGTALRVVLAGPVAYPLALSVASLASLAVAVHGYSQSGALFISGYRQTLRASDAVVGALATVGGLAVLIIVSRFALPRLAALRWTLPSKLLAAFLALAFVRGCAAVLEAIVSASFA
jgi:hypothetical protein